LKKEEKKWTDELRRHGKETSMAGDLRKIAGQLLDEVSKVKRNDVFDRLMTDDVYRARVKRYVSSPERKPSVTGGDNQLISVNTTPHQAFL